MSSDNLVGQTLDGKYKIESEIGKGGMGTVYLSTHVGTERAVAVKVIAPQFMKRAEFVERFRREARAAGRLRHPNVVDVTDFGFSETKNGRVAYLVMEYLDGCTLGEILDEEKRLPLTWSLDILEQVCSAVQEAHEQGIIHRDLKPDNIWLEPNGRGGYTVKVLDFGIAKLESSSHDHSQIENDPASSTRKARQTQEIQKSSTVSESSQTPTVNERKGATVASESNTLLELSDSKTFAAEAGTIIQPSAEIDYEGGTAILENTGTNILEEEDQGTKILGNGDLGTKILGDDDQGTKILENDDQGTKILSTDNETESLASKRSTSELTRVGAVLGTPLYMSPEQCRGEKLSSCSDIYSLGVIAYQMLSGKPPFSGEFTQVMEAHKNVPPPVFENTKIPVNVKKVIFAALEKDEENRPPSAAAFASKLRSQSEGVWTLMSRAMVLYSESFVKFFLLAFIVYLPMEILFLVKSVFSILSESGIIFESMAVRVSLEAVFGLSGIFSGTILTGITAWLVAQKMAVPVRPLKLRPAFKAVRKRLKPLILTAVASIVIGGLALTCFVFPAIVVWVCWALVTPVVMLEGLSGRKAFARSYQLVKRNLMTTVAVMVLSIVLGGLAGGVAGLMAKGLIGNSLNSVSFGDTSANSGEAVGERKQPENKNLEINIGQGQAIKINEKPNPNETESEKRSRRVRGTIRESAFAAIQIPLSTIIGSFFAVVLALLYIKTRLAGGESLNDLLEQFEETDEPRKKWQERVRGRLIQSGRITSRNSG